MTFTEGDSLNWEDVDDDAWDDLAEANGFSSDGCGLILAFLCEVEGQSIGDAVFALEQLHDSELLDMFSWAEIAEYVVDGAISI